MIRNVVVGRLKDGADEALLDEALRGLLLLPLDGLLEMHVGRDAGLREGSWDYVITADFADADAYRRYDADDEHNRLRRELFDVLSEQIARVQFEVPDAQAQPPATVPGEAAWVEAPPADGRRRGAR
ncbi:MAG TPA: Dabb family protein [Kineosporiaceae bacterium]|nr:Dabb family protein [Kineosporiaceae bacterium]